MKHFVTLFVILLVSLAADAQKTDLRETMKERLRESLKEKWRAPVPLVIEDEVALKTAAKPSEGRISTNGKSVTEGEISLAYHPADSSKLVISFMEESSTGLNFP